MSFFTRFRRRPEAPGSVRRAAAAALSVLAAVLVFLALVVPDQITRLPAGSSVPAAFVRLPIEALAALALLLVLPARARGVVAGVLGAALGLLTVVKVINMGFFTVLARQFDPVLDWPLFADGYRFVKSSVGRPGALAAVAGVILLAVAVVVLMTLAVRRLARVAAAHRTAGVRGVAGVSVAWLAVAALGTSFVPGVYVASDTAAVLAYDNVLKVPAAVQDRREFAAEAAADAFRDVPAPELLTGLRGKDVVFAFIESYGRSAIEDPKINQRVTATLADGTRRLTASGFSARSGFLTSPTSGGGSWLAHSTFQSGVWINNEQRYRSLVSGDRLTLTSAFRKATGWQTVGVEPGITYAWPEGRFYGFDRIYDSHTLGYHGPAYGWATMPDQFTLKSFTDQEYTRPERDPLMAELTFVSSHTPWAPIPALLDWDEIGDGSVYTAQQRGAASAGEVWQDAARVRAEYAKSVKYSVDSLVSWVQEYGDDNLVLVFLGDHQPAPIVVGAGASHDVPISIVARDPAVLDRVAGWGWTAGIQPGPQAPVWPMQAFRDKFLTAFGPQNDPPRPQSPPKR
ncbi:sulfatase-like hydrolase/transferase [Actinoplanes sp. NPDC049599]|uniref:sulfatase-like hydrolase/transferase n=1 Tax=Actinoplanes sp. NPDC049599 TaxID=3363903 RepID=UPI0037BA4C3C